MNIEDKSYLNKKCPVCKVGALEILNYTATKWGESYWTAKCTNCSVVFDKLNADEWGELNPESAKTTFNKQHMTVRKLYEMLKPIVNELGDCEILVRYSHRKNLDTYTPIRNQRPYFKNKMNNNSSDMEPVIIFDGY